MTSMMASKRSRSFRVIQPGPGTRLTESIALGRLDG